MNGIGRPSKEDSAKAISNAAVWGVGAVLHWRFPCPPGFGQDNSDCQGVIRMWNRRGNIGWWLVMRLATASRETEASNDAEERENLRGRV
jgi:hypothetical protein